MPSILDEIVQTKWKELADAKRRRLEAELEAQLERAPMPRGFRSALLQSQLGIIAEVKKASPSAGVIREDFDPVQVASIYQAHGAQCLSVLTDENYFQGHLDFIPGIRTATSLPILRKEFILDRYQLLEARIAGADAVLLIAEILPDQQLKVLRDQARMLQLDVLIELHDAEQLPRVLDCQPDLLGINNRDLRTFVTRLDHTLSLMPQIPTTVPVVSESGIRTFADAQMLQNAGVRAILVGESLMRSPDIGLALRQLRGVEAER